MEERKKRRRCLRKIYALYTYEGELFDVHETEEEAHENAIGSIFWPTYTVATYVLSEKEVKRHEGSLEEIEANLLRW